MKIKIPTNQEWQEFLEKPPNYSFFQLPLWAEVYEKTYPYCKVATKLFLFDNGVEILVPLIEKSYRFGFKSYESLADGGYGGFLWNRKPSEGQIKQILKYLFKNRFLRLIINPDPFQWKNFQFLEKYGFKGEWVFTHILKLNKPEILWQDFTYACRKNIKRTQKENLKIVEGKLDDLTLYYEMYKESTKRWGKKINKMIPLKFFQKLLQLGQNRIKLFFVEKENRKIAGAIIGYGKNETFQCHTASFYQYENLRPNNFWEWEVIKDSYQKGYKVHNFGASVGLSGVQRFKESFGAEKLNYKYFVYERPLLRIYKKAKLILRSLVKK